MKWAALHKWILKFEWQGGGNDRKYVGNFSIERMISVSVKKSHTQFAVACHELYFLTILSIYLPGILFNQDTVRFIEKLQNSPTKVKHQLQPNSAMQFE